ncbi:unnamed protein product [Boreogadus saida]
MVSVFFRGRGGEEDSQLRGSWPSHSSPLVLGHGCPIQLRPEMSGPASGARLFVCRRLKDASSALPHSQSGSLWGRIMSLQKSWTHRLLH